MKQEALTLDGRGYGIPSPEGIEAIKTVVSEDLERQIVRRGSG